MQTVVSLGIKNLKGLIDIESRKKCHNTSPEMDLHRYVSKFISVVPPSFTILDGIYSNEKGPYVRFEKGVGVESIHILEFDASKVEEASVYIAKRILSFSAVPGFSCTSQTWTDAHEAVKKWMD